MDDLPEPLDEYLVIRPTTDETQPRAGLVSLTRAVQADALARRTGIIED